MSNGKSESQSMLASVLSAPTSKEMIAQGLLPHGCTLHHETALTFARKARTADTLEKKDDFLNVVIEHLEEIKKKVEGAK